MRTFAMLVASAHICLAACQPAPESPAASPAGAGRASRCSPARRLRTAPPPANNSAAPTPVHALRQRLLGQLHRRRQQPARLSLALCPARRPAPRAARERHRARKHSREGAGARERWCGARERGPARSAAVRENAVVREKAPLRENVVNVPAPPPVRENAVVREKAPVREINAPAREKPPCAKRSCATTP